MSDEIVRLPVKAEVGQDKPNLLNLDSSGFVGELQTEQKLAEFLVAYGDIRNMSKAARRVGIPYSTLYWHKKNNPNFAAALLEVRENICDEIEERTLHRAIEGDPNDKMSATLEIFMLKSWRPEVYGERQEVRHTGPGGGPIQVQQMILELAAARRELEAGEAISYDSDKLPYQQDHLS